MVCTRVLSAVSLDSTLGDDDDAAMVAVDVAVVGRPACDEGDGDGGVVEEDLEGDDDGVVGVVGVIFMRIVLGMR